MHPAAQPRSLAALVHDRRGVVGLYFAVVLSTMALLAVAALDLIRVHMARSRVSTATDAAILAAGKSLSTLVVNNNNNGVTWQTVGAAFFNANMNSSMGLSAPMKPTDLKEVPTNTFGVVQVAMTINASLPLMSAAFGNLASIDMTVSASARNRSQTAELVMVLDNTGSMLTNNNIGALRTDAALLVDILADDPKATTLSKVRVGLVPYAATVNPGAETASYVTGKIFDANGGVNWRGCLLEPTGKDAKGNPYALADAPPTDVGWSAYEAPNAADNKYTPGVASTIHDAVGYGNDSTGPNVGCPTAITPMTRDIATLKSAITAMEAWSRGGTISDIGLAWGARLLSPAAPFTQAVPFRSGVPKFLVMMTDGEAGYYKLTDNQSTNKVNSKVISDYAGYGRVDQYGLLGGYGYSDLPMTSLNNATYVEGLSDTAKDAAKDRARQIINRNISALCTRLKGDGVEVFTITFGSLTADTRSIYQGCATNAGHYYNAPDQASLKAAFKAIGYAINEMVLLK